ncbi:hypothetical protein RN001_001788 [Aquatica leii]|uniref:Peptidase S1 domain-containing protein n=1 Tax=Aquatica leii TaxID=1421715 RepID=A0AAN7Q835_9COLE|nr:hypothetical protein RN001_001788 [Aquatica leii]
MAVSVNYWCFVFLCFMNRPIADGQVSDRRNDRNNYNYGIPGFCPSGTQCLPLIECPLLNKVFNHACAYSNRIGDMGCGYEGSGLVCCPITTNSPRANGNGQSCGTSLVSQGIHNEIGANPWVVRVTYKDAVTKDLKFPCSGSLISSRVVLTAAHCAVTKSENYKLYGVRVGEWSTSSSLDCGEEFCALPVQDITVSHVILHPGYEQQNFKDNVALLVLNDRVNYTVTAQPICLPQQWSIISNYGVLVGWGKLAGQFETSPLQQTLQLPIVALQQCLNIYGSRIPISENHLCVGGVAGRDACDGFGGSPLIEQQNGKHFIIGLLSFGSDRCGAAGIPSVYTNVKKYTNWINENIPIIRN